MALFSDAQEDMRSQVEEGASIGMASGLPAGIEGRGLDIL